MTHDDATPTPRGTPVPPRTAVISGATGGVGPAVAARFARGGCALALPVRSDVAAARERYPDALVLPADLTDPADAREVARRAEAELGSIDAVVHVAGGFGMRSALELDANDLERQLSLNLRTAAYLTGAVAPAMAERGRGAIVGLSAAAASVGGANLAAYAASKAALEGYLRSVRAELAPKGVTVSIVTPVGPIDTPANREAMRDADPSDWIAAEAVAEALWFLASGSAGARGTELRLTP